MRIHFPFHRRGNTFLGLLVFVLILGTAAYIVYRSDDFQKNHRRDIQNWKKRFKDYLKSAKEVTDPTLGRMSEWAKTIKLPENIPFLTKTEKVKKPTYEELIYNPDVLNREIPQDMVRHQLDEITICAFDGNYLFNNVLSDKEILHIANIFRFCDLTTVSGIYNQANINKMTNLLKDLRYNAANEISPGIGKKTKIFQAFIYRNDRIQSVAPAKLLSSTKGLPASPYVGTFKSGDFDFTIISYHTPSDGFLLDSMSGLETVYDSVLNENPTVGDVFIFGNFVINANDVTWDNSSLLPNVARLKKDKDGQVISQSQLLGNFWLRRKHLVEFNGNSGVIDIDESQFPSISANPNKSPGGNKPIWVQFRAMPDDD